MNEKLILILISSFGALTQEILHWYDLRGKLDHQRYKKMIKSGGYWIIISITIVVSGVGTFLLFSDNFKPDNYSIPFILGAAFPLLFKKAVSGISKNTNQHLGGKNEDYFT